MLTRSSNDAHYQKKEVVDSIESNIDRSVFLLDDGRWANKRNDLPQPSSVHETRAEAVEAAKMMLQSQGGGELVVFDKTGRIVNFGFISAFGKAI